MRLLQQLEAQIDQMPPWAQILVGVFLVVYSILSIYGRIKPRFGKKIFSKIPEAEIRTNTGHIIGYTVIPVIVTAGYFFLLCNR